MRPTRPAWRPLLSTILLGMFLPAGPGLAAAPEPARSLDVGNPKSQDQVGASHTPPYRPEVELERRLDYLRRAIDHLHAAGLHEEADQVAEEMELWERYYSQKNKK